MTSFFPNQAGSSVTDLPATQNGTQFSSNLDKGSPGSDGPKLQTSTRGTKRSFSWDDDGPVSSGQRPSRYHSQKVPISKEGDPPRIISNLFYGTIEFWLLVLGERSWPFSFAPAPPKTANSDNNSDQNSSLYEMKPHSSRTENPPVFGTIDSSAELEPSDAKYEQNFWDEARFQLGEKRDQLCMWKVGISDRALDGLLESKSDIYRQLGKAILEALLRLAVSMSTAIDVHKTSEQASVNDDMPLLQESAQRLNNLIEEATKITSDNPLEYDPRSHKMTPTFATTTQLLARLQLDITRLLDLSIQIQLAATN